MPATIDRMSPLDAFFIYTEDDGVNHMHVGGFALIKGTPPSQDEMLDMVAGKLPLIPRYRQVPQMVPFHLGRPVWADAQHFDITQHIHREKLPSPGGEAELTRFLGRHIGERLDRSRPLWELWVIEGVGPDEWAVAWKIHHCMIDGVSGTELLTVLFDTSPEPTPAVEDDWAPRPRTPEVKLWTDAAAELVKGSAGKLASLRPVSPVQLAKNAQTQLQLSRRMTGGDPTTPLNGRIGRGRSYAYTTVPLAQIKLVREAFGGTVNDVVLTAIAAGYSDLLATRGGTVKGKSLKVMVPVALRERDASGRPVGDGTLMTKASALIAELPLDVPDPVERLAAVRKVMEQLKQSGEADAMTAINDAQESMPASFVALGLRAVSALPQRAINTVVTNVQGPQQTLYIRGREITSIYSYAPPFPVGARTSVAVYSYKAVLHFGITGDRDSMPDVHLVTDGVAAEMTALVAASASKKKPKK